MIAAPPVFAGADQDTTLEPETAPVARTAVGEPESPRGTTAAEGREASDEPATFDEVTVNE